MTTELDGKDGTTNGSANGRQPRARKRAAVAAVVDLPAQRDVSAEHLENLRASGLSDATIEAACLYTERHAARLKDLAQRRWPSSMGHALVFPFYLPGADKPHAYRLRPSHPRIERKRNGKQRAVKYEQPAGSPLLVYYPPRARAAAWYRDVERVLYWTEGEKKALALDQLDRACVGLTGVWNWTDPDADGDALHPTIAQHVTVAGRAHVIVYDADARDNHKVMLAASRLCGLLLQLGAASVHFVAPPDVGAAKGIDDYLAAHGEQATCALLDNPAEIEPADVKQPLTRLRSVKSLRDAPLSDALRLPAGYDITRDGALWRSAVDDKHGDTRVTSTPMFIVRDLADLYTTERRVELTWPANDNADAWPTLIASRKAIADSRSLVAELAPYGAPVTSNSAAKVVDWLEAYGEVNASAIERVACVSRTGWHDVDGATVFASHAILTTEGASVSVALDTRDDRRALFAAMRPKGELQRHIDALGRAWNADPVCAAAICAAFAAPLLRPLAAGNFAVHLPGESSRGKTSMLKIGASVYGDPSSTQWVAQWSISAAAAELRASTLCDLPQCYDEIGGRDVAEVERMLYMLINGAGRARASRDLSLRFAQQWRTIVLSTGERELAEETSATGAQVRVVQLPVSGFGALTAAQVDALRDECSAHAGQAGERWLRALLDVEDWAALRDMHAGVLRELRAQAQDPLQGRVAAYFATLAVAEALVATLFAGAIGDTNGMTMRNLFANIAARERVLSAAERARELVEDWVTSEPDAFPELEPNTFGEGEPRKTSKTVRYGFRRGDGTLLLIPAQFKAFCERHRLPAREVVREWIRKGWSSHDAGRLALSVRLGAFGRAKFYTLHPVSSESDSDTR